MAAHMTHPQLVSYKGVYIRQLRASPQILRDALRHVSPQQLEATPIPGKWSTRHCVEHIVLVSLGWSNIFYEAIEDALDVHERNNLRLADFLANLPPLDWTRKFPPVQWLTTPLEIRDHLHWGVIGHLYHHLLFIAQKRAALGLSPGD